LKGIVLAGGSGTRLYPITKAVSKQLLPIYDKPLIYYPLSILLLAEINDILIVSTPEDIDNYKKLFGSGENLGISISYSIQLEPKGIAEVFIIAEDFIGSDSVCLILGDNLFYGQNLSKILLNSKKNKGATIFGYPVNNPSEFGVVEFDEKFKVLSLEEKPANPKSNYAVPGLYFYDNKVISYSKIIQPSSRGELEITSINNCYLNQNDLHVEVLGRGFAWLDTGSPDGLISAASFVETIQKRQGFYVSCLEEIAWRKGFISTDKLLKIGESLKNSDYGKYLIKLVKGLS